MATRPDEAAEALGQSTIDLLHATDDFPANARTAIVEAALTVGKWEGVADRLRSNGQRRRVRVVVTPRRDAEGRPIGLLRVAKDVSGESSFRDEIRRAKLFDDAIVGTPQEAVDKLLELAQINARRAEQLFKNRLIPQSDHDTTMAALHQAEAMVKIREASLKKAKTDLERTTIYAPIDGVVISRNIEVGQTVAAVLSEPAPPPSPSRTSSCAATSRSRRRSASRSSIPSSIQSSTRRTASAPAEACSSTGLPAAARP